MDLNLNKSVKIGVLQPDNIYKNGLIQLLQSCEKSKLIFNYSSTDQLDTQLLKKIDVFIIDYLHTDLKNIKIKRFKTLKVLAINTKINKKTCIELINNGIHGYLNRDTDPHELCTAINCLMNHGIYFNTSVIDYLITLNNRKSKLITINNIDFTRNEIEVICHICDGCTNKEIADLMFKSIRTIEGYRSNIKEKLNCNNSADIIKFAIRYELVEFIHQ